MSDTKKMTVGAQLYTVRASCTTLEDFGETLKRVADIGYTTVQVSGTCPYPADWLREQLRQNGLRCVLTHIPPERLVGDTEKAAEEHSLFGCEYVGLGYYPFRESKREESYDYFLETYLPVARRLKALGKYLMYHNHDQEFQHRNGRTILENLAEDFPAEYMGFTLDTFWVQAGGGDPAGWLEYLKDRVPCIHLKDFAYGRKMAVVGEGNLDFDRILKKAEEANTRYLLVEQDDCGGEDPLACLGRSYRYLRAMGLD